MIKAIFWDNDGVLVDTEGLFFRANRDVLAGLGLTLSLEQFEEISLVRGQSVMRLAADPETDAFMELRHQRDTRYAELLEREPLVMDGVREVLDTLAGKYVMGIVTSSSQAHFDIIHKTSGLLPYFQFVLTLKDVTRTKPHPEPYQKAMAICGLSPNECLVVEDSPRGLAAASVAGIRCVVIPGPFTCGRDFTSAWRVCDSVRDLPALLAGM